MLQIDLMTIFNGLIKNYINLDLDKNSTSEEIVKKESKYFLMIGRLLGLDVNHTGINPLEKEVVIKWSFKDEDTNIDLEINREEDLLNDLSAIHKLINEAKRNTHKSYIKIIETSSINRINYLNNIILSSNIKNNILVIYIIKDILNNISYYNSYLFKDSIVNKEKKAMIKVSKEYKLKGLI